MHNVNPRPSIDCVNCLFGDVVTILDNRFFVESGMYTEVAERFIDMWPHLVQGEIYEAAELVGYEYWSGLSNRERSVCVLILKDFALDESPLISDWAHTRAQKPIFFVNHVEPDQGKALSIQKRRSGI